MSITDPRRSDKPSQRTLRFWLACLVLACVLPVCVTAGFLIRHAYQQKRQLLEQSVLETTRALSMVVDQQLAAMQASATALATSPFLLSGDLLAFRGQAQAVLPDYPTAAAVTLTDPTGQQVANTFVPLGTPLPKRVVWDQMQTVFESGKPVVINLYRGAISGRPVVGVAVPVVRDGRVVYVLTVTVPALHFASVLSQSVPPNWPATILDGNRVVVARNQLPEKSVGLPSVLAGDIQNAGTAEGRVETKDRDGVPVVAIFSRSAKSGWTVTTGIPKAAMLAGLRQWLWWMVGGALLLLLTGLGLALFLARRISGSLRALIAPALALGSGEPVDIAPLDLAETNEVGQSLVKASQLMQQRTAERERAEQELRESEEKFRRLIDQTKDHAIFMLDPDGRVVSWNSGAQSIKGYTEAEIIGRHMSCFYTPEDVEQGKPELLLKVAAERGLAEEEGWRVRKDGSRFWAEVTLSALHDDSGRLRGFSKVTRDITERKRAEQRIAHLASFPELNSNPILEIDLQEKITYANPAATAWFPGITEIGTNHPTLKKWAAVTAALGADVQPHVLIREVDSAGTVFQQTINYLPDIGLVRIYFADITQRKQAEEQLQKLNRTLTALSNSNQALMHTTDEPAFLQQVCRIIHEDCGYAMVWIGFAEDDQNKTVRPVASAGFEEGYLETMRITWADSERGRGPTGTAIRTGQPSICRNMLTDPAFLPWREQAVKRGYASSLVVPLKEDDKVFGAITIYSREPDAFLEGEVHLLTELAADLAYGINTLRVRAAHAQAEESLRRQADLLRLSFDAIIVWRMGGAIESWNLGAERLYGFSESEALGLVSHELLRTIHPVPWPQLEAELRESRFWEGELHHFTKDGREVIVSARKQLIPGTDGVERVLEMNRDITERKRAEEERETTVEFLRLVNRSQETRELIQAATTFFQQRSACEAVGIRLQEGKDFPYFEYRGFSKEFVQVENLLCKPDESGLVALDSAGDPVLDCMCGNVIRGRFDPSQPFFTANGSFWANDTTRLLATTTGADRQARTRNRCNGEGYESVALIALRVGEQRLGLLQLNDRQKGRFSLEAILLWERLAGYLAAALSKFRAEEALRESEEQFRELAEGIPQLAWTANPDGWIYWYNQRWYQYTGTTPRQMEGWGWQSVHDPNKLPKVVERWKDCIATGETFDMVFPLLGADGVFRPFLTRVTPLRDTQGRVVRWFGTNTDISEQRRVEEALRQSEERWATTLRSIGDAVISTCARGKVIFMNEVAEKLTGWPLSEAHGRDLEEVFNIVNEVTRQKPESPVDKVIRMGQVVGLANHTALICRDGIEYPIEDSGAPIRNQDGEITGVVLVFHDVVEKRKAEKAVRHSERLAVTGRLAATLAHEIHNPLDTVGNLLYLMDLAPDLEAARQHVALASQEVARVTQMTRHMLAFQRESNKPVPVNIAEILDSVITLFARKIESTDIRIEKQIQFDHELLGLPSEIRQVFANLFGNAVEALGQNGKIRLHAYVSRNWRTGRRGLRVVVADNGPGIPADIRGKIFEPFFTTKGEAGTGLGLWITSGIVEKNDGTLRLRTVTRAGRTGTCFSVFFPIK